MRLSLAKGPGHALLLCLALLLTLAGCAAASSASSFAACTSTTSAACAVGSGASQLQLFIEPQAGVRPITDAIRSARHAIWIEMYILTDTSVIEALENAANRGVDVRVLLEPHPVEFSPVSVQEDKIA
ncbi:MAG TPA: phospholipase D-like domain-containing protein [Ktedonobacterales bacterium]|jgi:phosphatidylserine/phosphatidylglycerophosphate/cardiolipin synthase-like enzyme